MDPHQPMSRRQFLVKGTALFTTLGLGGALLAGTYGRRLFGMSGALEQEDAAGAAVPEAGSRDDGKAQVLVVIQLSGGNDGLNTVVPYGQGAYFDARPTLKLGEKDVLDLNGQVGLHPSLAGLKKLYDQGKLAVIQGVGYPKPDRSHFRSMEIWQTAEPEKLIHSGWLGRYGETSLRDDRNPLKLAQIGGGANKAFTSDSVNVPVIQTLDSFAFFDPKTPSADRNRIARAFLDMYDPARQGLPLRVTCRYGKDAYAGVEAIQGLNGRYVNRVDYPKTGIARDLQAVAKLLAGGSGTRVFYVQLGGFDDHAQEKEQHAKLLKDLDEGMSAFYQDLEAQGLQDRVAMLAFSEFGRRVRENGSGGTDHGTAAPVLVLGGRVKGGLYGVYPSLTGLDNGDLKYEVDFRSIYYTLVDNWLKGDAKGVLGRTYEKLAFL